MKISLFLSGLVAAAFGVFYWISGAQALEIGVAYMVSGLTTFVALAVLGTFKGILAPAESHSREIYADMLALEEALKALEREGRADIETLQRARRLQGQLQSGLPRSSFGG